MKCYGRKAIVLYLKKINTAFKNKSFVATKLDNFELQFGRLEGRSPFFLRCFLAFNAFDFQSHVSFFALYGKHRQDVR